MNLMKLCILVPLIIFGIYNDWITCLCIIYGIMFDIIMYGIEFYYQNPYVVDNKKKIISTRYKIIVSFVCCIMIIYEMFTLYNIIGYVDEYFFVYFVISFSMFCTLCLIFVEIWKQVYESNGVVYQHNMFVFRIICICLDTCGLYLFEIFNNGYFLLLILGIWLCVEVASKFRCNHIFVSGNTLLMYNLAVHIGIIYLLNFIWLS